MSVSLLVVFACPEVSGGGVVAAVIPCPDVAGVAVSFTPYPEVAGGGCRISHSLSRGSRGGLQNLLWQSLTSSCAVVP